MRRNTDPKFSYRIKLILWGGKRVFSLLAININILKTAWTWAMPTGRSSAIKSAPSESDISLMVLYINEVLCALVKKRNRRKRAHTSGCVRAICCSRRSKPSEIGGAGIVIPMCPMELYFERWAACSNKSVMCLQPKSMQGNSKKESIRTGRLEAPGTTAEIGGILPEDPRL